MNHDSGGEIFLHLPISRKGIFHQLVCTFFGQVWLKVFFGDRSRSPAYNDSLATLVEDLRDTRQQSVLVEALVEAHPDITDCKFRTFSRKAPRHAFGLVVQSSVDV